MRTHTPTTRRAGRERGVALMLVVVALAIAATLAVSFIAAQSTNIGIASNAERQTHARAIAEAALQMTIAEVRTNTEWRTTFSNGQWVNSVALDGGTFSVWGEDGQDVDGDGTIETATEEGDGDLADDLTDVVTIIIVATYQGVTHTVQAVVTPGGEAAEHLNVLLVVHDASSLTSAESSRKAYIESWGYKVTPISDSASQSDFDAALLASDVVYVAQEANATSIGTKLADTGLGVVIEDNGLYSAEGISTSSGTVSTKTIQITNNSHDITSPFSIGSVTIGSSNLALLTQTGTVSSGATVLGKTTGGSPVAVLTAIELGGTTHSGGQAPGRRVALPWGQSGLVFSDLNDNGLTIMQRSLDWAAQPPKGPPAVAHWRLDDGSGNKATDSNGTNNGTVYGGALWSVGQVGGGMDFDGIDDRVQIPHNNVFNVTNSLSVTAWVKGDTFSTSNSVVNVILRKGEGNPNVWQFAIDGRKVAMFLNDYDSGGFHGNTSLNTGKWYHVAGTWDGSKVKLYVNGVVDNGSGASRTGTIPTDSRDVYLGGRSGTDQFDGHVDDVRFYNRALNALEIKAMYDEGTATTRLPIATIRYDFQEVKPNPQLVSHWKLDETGNGGGGLAVKDQVDINGTVRIDSYRSKKGAYSLSNKNTIAALSTNSTSSGRISIENTATLFGSAYCGSGGNANNVINAPQGTITGSRSSLSPNVSFTDQAAPSGMPASQGNKSYSSNQLWITNQKFADLTLASNAIVTITGNIKVECTGNFVIKNSAQIVVSAGASLTLYCGGNATIQDTAVINTDTAAPGAVTIIGYNTGYLTKLTGDAQLAANILVDEDVRIEGNAQFFGSMKIGDDLTIMNAAQLHVDTSQPGVGITDPPAGDETGLNPGYYRNGVLGNQAGAASFTATSAYFDGVNDYLEVAHHDSYLLRSGTIAFWFKPDAVTTEQGLISKDSSGYDNGGQFTIAVINKHVRVRLESKTTTYEIETKGNLSAAAWHHVAFTFGPDGMNLYVDGASKGSNTYTGGLGTTSGGSGNDEPIAIGVDTSASGNGTVSGYNHPYKGYIDDVRIYDYAVDSAQVSSLYAGNSLGTSTLAGSTVPDTSGYGGVLDLLIADTSTIAWPSGGGLTLNADLRLKPSAPAAKIVTGVTVNNTCAIEAEFQSSTDTQSGPARVVAFGQSATDINFFLGVDGKNLVVRLRTTDTSTSASPDITVANVLSKASAQHVVVCYDGEQIRIYVNGSLVHSVDRTGELTNWDSTAYIAVGNDPTTAKPWRGTLHKVVVWDQSMDNGQVGRLMGGEDPGLPGGTGGTFSAVWNERP